MAVGFLVLCVSCWAVGASRRYQNCDDIDSASNSLFSSNLCGELLLPTDGDAYLRLKEQYATSSYPDRTKPSMIIQPFCDEDIKLAIAYAKQCALTITIRSGGHQYSGLSSCNTSCIQIDMADYDHLEVSNETTLISAGVNVRLGDFYAALADEGYNLPGGGCSEVALGGHVQTGGFGHGVRSHGILLDHVVAFDIILEDGESRHVIKPEVGTRTSRLNDDLFWAVLGGSPGAWGVVTNYELIADRDADSSPMIVGCIWGFDAATLKELVLNFMAIHENEDYLNDANNGVWISVHKRAPEDTNIIFAKCLWHGLDHAPYDSTICDMLLESAKALNPAEQCFNWPVPLSTAYTSIWTYYFDREYNFPYLKVAQTSDANIEADFVDAYVEKVDEIMDSTNGVFFVSELASVHGLKKFDPDNELTSISRRGAMFCLLTDLFYAEPLNADAKSIATEWLATSWGEWLANGLFNDGVDERMTWATNAGSVDIETVWPFYYEADLYRRLKRIKRRVDPDNVFQTPFTIPIDDDGNKRGRSAESFAAAAPSTSSALIGIQIYPSALFLVTVCLLIASCVVSVCICKACQLQAPRKYTKCEVQ